VVPGSAGHSWLLGRNESWVDQGKPNINVRLSLGEGKGEGKGRQKHNQVGVKKFASLCLLK